MSKERRKATATRGDLLREVGAELGPRLSTATVFFHETLSGLLGLNATDTKCLGFIFKSTGPVTAGDLARFTGLTTGAVSSIIDRLEKAKLVERVRDIKDRRKVFVREHKRARERVAPLYESLRTSVEALATSYSTADLQVIADFLEKSIHLLETETEKLRKQGP